MANSWLRLWHDMPNDPKWRTVARLSGQPIALVQATYVHLLVSASQSVTRGHADVTAEDLASALDVTDRDIALILDAMQGRVLEGTCLSGWDKRQVKRDDSGNPETGAMSAAERKRAQRERQRLAKESQGGHDGSRKVTPDKDKDKDLKPLSLAGVSEISSEGKTPPMAEGPFWDDQDDESPQFGKFLMSASWQPSPDFQRQAVLWNKKLEGPAPGYTAEELASFIAFWKAEGRVYHQTQWEQKFADSVLYERQAAAKRKQHTGGSNATRHTAAAATAQQQVRAARNAERERQGLAPLGDDGGDLRQPLGDQERGGTIHDLGPGDFEILR
ncbi:DnaT-like ssDNA-binding domain-containing protein [Serratia proteamaculans]|uniref:DnaT-like ssDNA-binding domain-containing protein n=1 Tax=Serratia proteamaculans TaxID=28151 RepID=UPI0021BDE367|nr:DnaT-like ssDNA-binding domain-containing protein [Serratia proteamaculans]